VASCHGQDFTLKKMAKSVACQKIEGKVPFGFPDSVAMIMTKTAFPNSFEPESFEVACQSA
jgi:hypothetical protein